MDTEYPEIARNHFLRLSNKFIETSISNQFLILKYFSSCPEVPFLCR